MPLLPSASSRKRYGHQTILVHVDGNPAYPRAIEELKDSRELGRRCRCRPIRYLNNIVEQDHRAIKRRVRAMQGFRSFDSAWRMIQGFETVNMIRKGQIRWCAEGQHPWAGRIHSRPLRSHHCCLTTAR
jgi:transposase-like protein